MTLLNLLSDYEFGLSNRGAWARLPEEKADFILNTRYKELLTTATNIHYAIPLLEQRTLLPKGGC